MSETYPIRFNLTTKSWWRRHIGREPERDPYQVIDSVCGSVRLGTHGGIIVDANLADAMHDLSMCARCCAALGILGVEIRKKRARET